MGVGVEERESGRKSKHSNELKFKRMFDFEKLDIYQVLRDLNYRVFVFLNEDKKIDPYVRDLWKKASSIIISV